MAGLGCLRPAQTPLALSVEGGQIRAPPDVADGHRLQGGTVRPPPVGVQPLCVPHPVCRGRGHESTAWPTACYQLAIANPPGTFYVNEYYWDPSQRPKDTRTVSTSTSGRRRSRPPWRCRSLSTTTAAATPRQQFLGRVQFLEARSPGVLLRFSAAYRSTHGVSLARHEGGGAGNFAILDSVEVLKWDARPTTLRRSAAIPQVTISPVPPIAHVHPTVCRAFSKVCSIALMLRAPRDGPPRKPNKLLTLRCKTAAAGHCSRNISPARASTT